MPLNPVAPFAAELAEGWKEFGKTLRIPVQGASMYPSIEPGDRVDIRCMPPERLKPGDIAAFWSDESIVVHRIIHKRTVDGALWFCEKGDNLTQWSWIREKRLIGRVERILKSSGDSVDLTGLPLIVSNTLTARFACFRICLRLIVKHLRYS